MTAVVRPFLIAALLGACGTPSQSLIPIAAPSRAPTGVLVMAHGGGGAWDRAVGHAVRELNQRWPTAVAFGMANRETLQAATDSLTGRGVRTIAVVRLFVSGTSFLDQTNYLLGLDPSPPPFFLHHAAHGSETHHQAIPPPISTEALFKTHLDGLSDYSEVAEVLVDRAREISEVPDRESVLVLAHGVGDPEENQELLTRMARHAKSLESEGFQSVIVETLREDWADERTTAEQRIRAFVTNEVARGRTVLVLPFRVHGFGPYADVLEGLPYRPGRGLLPHSVTQKWLVESATRLLCPVQDHPGSC